MDKKEPTKPPVWGVDRLEADRKRAIELFIQERGAEGSARYIEAFDANLARVSQLFEATRDLRDLTDGQALSSDPSLLAVARYLAGPPISADDLDTLTGEHVTKRRRINRDIARKAAAVIEIAIDQRRFPWLFQNRQRRPNPTDREIAIRWTTGLKTAQEVQTRRRSESSARQEAAVMNLLEGLGFRRVPARRITATEGLERGEFSREADVAGTKCDVPVGLRDGRLLLIECKVSNSALNGVKRLNRETAGKAAHWRLQFGVRAVTAAALSGVFKLANLEAAQSAGVTIFWEHDLESLGRFVSAAG